MYRLSLIISEIYNKYLPLAEKGDISLNLDFSDTTQTVTDPESIKADLDKHLGSALSRSERGEISIAVEQNAIIITDSGTILSKPICTLLSKGRVSITSRVGFGTTVRISLLPSTPATNPLTEPASAKSNQPTAKLPGSTKTSISQTSTKSQTATKKLLKTSTKTAKPNTKPSVKSKNKPTHEQRKLISAAKKADRKIQKLRQSQQKSRQKAQQKPKQSQKPEVARTPKRVVVSAKTKPTKTKPAKKTHRKIIELS